VNSSDLGTIASPLRRARTVIAFLAVAMVAAALAAPPAESTPFGPTSASAFTAASWDTAPSSIYSVKQQSGDMYWVTREVTGADDYWNAGYTGKGVDIALIDTGVVPVAGLAAKGKIVNAPDFSFDTISDPLEYLDAYGHGTHLAGIIAGKDSSVLSIRADSETQFLGMAPDSRLVNVKAGDVGGVVDVSQVVAAIDWVVRNRDANGLNIRVINLSYGTDGNQDTVLDPLAHAVERAWRAGIIVVVAAGNDGNGAALRNPAYDPYVIAVGAADAGYSYSTADDSVPSFSNCGTSSRHVDLVAPGKSIVSLRAPGSTIDKAYPDAVVADRFFLGSGTSQAAAVVSGAAALVIQQRPTITPDELKALLMRTAQEIPFEKEICQGAGLIDLSQTLNTATEKAKQTWKESKGEGSLEQVRGSFHVELMGDVLEGEHDIFGEKWNAKAYYENGGGLKSFLNGWSGASWSGLSWSSLSWSGLSWSGASWSGLSWSGLSWSGASWSGKSWSVGTWSGLSWKIASAR
jgi:serine protease AprX